MTKTPMLPSLEVAMEELDRATTGEEIDAASKKCVDALMVKIFNVFVTEEEDER